MIRHLELALDRRSRLKLLLNAMQAGGKAGGDRQVGVGVGPGQTVLDPTGHRRAGRNAQTRCTIVL
ncbi:hypothetical protein D3C73_1649500 [compost metagenome]